MIRPHLPRWLRWVVATLLVALAGAWAAGHVAERRVIAALAARTGTDARLRATLLDSEIARYRLLPIALADDRDVVAAIDGDAAARATLNRKLESLAGVTRAPAIYVIGRDGRAIAASNWRTPRSFVGTDYRFRRYVREAQALGQASQFALGTVSRRPGLYLAQRTRAGGIIVIKLEFDTLEAAWARAGGITFVTDPRGLVLVTSRPRWRFARAHTIVGPGRGAAEATIRRARFVTADMPTMQPGWRLTLLQPVTPAIAPVVRAWSAGAGLAVVALAALAFAIRQRAALRRQRTAELEQAVAARTAELEQAVAARTGELRREMGERAASEAQAAALREGLRQANRLATLGQITASVAHETAQPVAAIRTYAEAGALLLERGDQAQVRANLAAITRLTERIGTVTAELRGFSRRSADAVRAVALAEVIEGALLILKEQLRAVTLVLPEIDPALAVRGGKVRLEQVLVNLLQNALEALAGRDDARIAIALAADAETVRMTITDNGPGIAPTVADRLFTPFVTSRATGLGLGLVIAHDIAVEFGGALRLLPGAEGACFEIEMRRA